MQGSVITVEELASASDGELISNLPAPTPLPEGEGLSLPPIQQDERDSVSPLYPHREWTTERGTIYQKMKETRWILAKSPNSDPIFPEREILREFIYDCNGVLGDILEKMQWHNASKGEFMRWVSKLCLENDILIARDNMVDKAESVVNRNLNEVEDVETAKFVLKTVGKKRGWNERVEDINTAKNVYQFINIASGEGNSNLSGLDEAGLVKYLEDALSSNRK